MLLAAAGVLRPVVVNPARLGADAGPALLDSTDADFAFGNGIGLGLRAAVVMDGKMMDALAAALAERALVFLAFGLHGLISAWVATYGFSFGTGITTCLPGIVITSVLPLMERA